MRKKHYKKSQNETSIQPILKVVTDSNNQDKIYQGKAKSGLISYLLNEHKEGKIDLVKNGDINREESLKHIIFSPCGVDRWSKMNDDEKLNLRSRYFEKLQTDYRNYNFLLAVEEKERKDSHGNNITMEHYHLVISSKVETGSKFKNIYKRSLMHNYIENYTTQDTRSKLGVKTNAEIRQSKSDKMKLYYENKLQTQLDKGELSLLYGAMKSIFRNKNIDINLNRQMKYNVLQRKQDIFSELSNIKSSMNNSISFLKTIDESLEYLSQNKTTFISNFHRDLSAFRENRFNELKSFKLYTNYEHSFFVKHQKMKAKNGIISYGDLITSVSRSKVYWKSEEERKRRSIENQIFNQQETLKKKILTFESRIAVLISDKANQQQIQYLLNQDIKFKKSQSSSLDSNIHSIENKFQRKIEHYYSYLSFLENKISDNKKNMNESYQQNLLNNLQI